MVYSPHSLAQLVALLGAQHLPLRTDFSSGMGEVRRDSSTRPKGRSPAAELIVRQDDIPAEVRGRITHWSRTLDHWAADWDFRDDAFQNQ